MYKINHANIKDWAANYDGELFDGILCDPPYELGFMGKSWDSSGIAFDTEMWADLLKLLKPGGHLLAFSGSRTYHRMAVAIEDAGFEIRDMIEWVYGSGFPKSLNIAKQLDKMVSVETGSVPGQKQTNVTLNGTKDQPSSWDNNEYGGGNAKCDKCGKWFISGSPCTCPKEKVEYKTDEGRLFEGYGTALKPAHEPCVLARKPIEGTVANNVLKHGTGGLNIDGSRINTKESLAGGSGRIGGFAGKEQGGDVSEYRVEGNSIGRFPANLIHDGSDEVEAVFPNSKSASNTKSTSGNHFTAGNAGVATRTVYENGAPYAGETGSASRFFYCAKSSKGERNAGLEGFEDRIAGGMQGRADGSLAGNIVMNKNHHPTVKPLSLTKYLATLIKPPTGGRLLVPFSGSGSEMIGALQAGWEYVEGVELTEEYIPIAEARIEYWLKQMNKQLEIL